MAGTIGKFITLFVDPVSAILGAASVISVSGWLPTLFKLITGKEGMGAGDFKLLAVIGAWCGIKAILPVILLSSFVGAIIGGIWLATAGKNRDTQIPFGQYLAIAGWIQFIAGVDFLGLYLAWAAGS